MRAMFSMLVLVLIMTGCGYIPFSGAALSGEVTPVPASWSDVAQAKIIKLETRPEAPYSVNLWVTGSGGYLYIHAGANRAEWVDHIEANPDIRLGHAGRIYELKASRVGDNQEFAAFVDVYEKKDGNPPRNMNLSGIYLYRLTQRGESP